ncbi:FAD/NAD(P)-binding domain-containing protein [Tilletiaria anomala UBC 951]|uniref:FAD/NAD(P)-binding domain-containing protein n=1 Tax=Tilletiaria anomala (strain ATCC 24038 / CBS 436.72 / UBC 951) TaxID=1037660 RepID=A0A066WNT2_TILAU|nr:FAD/NAD(P)-binding domain-containing protein [Tilletiaria anomala UBC 951]KDN52664.1 FAD/NAD(P)-binding domain-containing protein [Tilletiaria anomala UBC 951]
MSPLPDRVDFLVVGAGPVGLTVTCAILNNLPAAQRSERSLLLIDKLPSPDHVPQNESRALALHARSFEVLADVVDAPEERQRYLRAAVRGRDSAPLLPDITDVPDKVQSVTQALLERGEHIQHASMRLHGRVQPVLRGGFASLHDTQFRQVCAVPQRVTEAVLRARLADLRHAIRSGWSVVHLEKSPGSFAKGQPVAVTLEHAQLGTHILQADFVIGADGGHSSVRALSGLAFPRNSYDRPLLLGEVTLADPRWPWQYPSAGFNGLEATNIFSSNGFLLLVPVPGGRIRLAANFGPPGFDPKTAGKRSEGGGHVEGNRPTIPHLQWILDNWGPAVPTEWIDGGKGDRTVKPSTIVDCYWSSTFRIHHGIVHHFLDPESGSIALIGDAAHCHSPMGGKGLNTGIHDATSLAMTLVRNLDASRDARLRALRAWADERRKVGLGVLKGTHSLTVMASLRHPILVRLRDLLFRILAWVPGIAKRIARETACLSDRPRGWTLPKEV